MRKIERYTAQSKGRLLVVDDDLVQRSIIGKIGARIGYDAVIASTFEVAAELLRNQTFDIMTLDLSLGERDGVEILRLVADLKRNSMPIVIISGCEERILNTAVRVGRSLGLFLTSCLNKPLNLDSLRDALCVSAADCAIPEDRSIAPAVSREKIVAALARDEFFVELQPKVDLETGRVVGAEALARWLSPEFGLVSPNAFIPLIEQFGLMPDLTYRMLASGIADSRALIDENPGFVVAVNVSGSLMNDLAFPERVESLLREQAVAPSSLLVEMTESVAMSDVGRAMDILVRLRIKGVGAAIDDFGTGFSSLTALAKLPFSELKIDQSFVKRCDSDEDMMKIVEASVGLARAFGMKVVAEGIDRPETLAKARQVGCDVGQGFLFSPPMKAERLGHWIDERFGRWITQPADQKAQPPTALPFQRPAFSTRSVNDRFC